MKNIAPELVEENASLQRVFTARPSRLESDPAFEQLGHLLRGAGQSIVVSWPGHREIVGVSPTTPPPELAFETEEVCRRALRHLSLLSLARAYLDGDLEIIGDLLKVMPIIETINVATDTRQTWIEWLSFQLFSISKTFLPWRTNRFESLDHYAKSADAFRLMLDRHMQYTCGYYLSPDDTLEAAQQQKFELIRTWLVRHGGELAHRRHIDIGCGWGGLVHYFASEFGTRSIGLTNSPQQRDFARSHFKIPVTFGDFSVLSRDPLTYDLVTIVGMIEHLTSSRRNSLFQLIAQRLARDGLVYVQCIQRPSVWIGGDAYRLVQQQIFPGHYLESHDDTRTRFERLGFEILEYVEHRSHYAATTAAWLRNVQANAIAFERIMGRRDFRLFVGFLALASQLFASGRGSLGRYLLRRRAE